MPPPWTSRPRMVVLKVEAGIVKVTTLLSMSTVRRDLSWRPRSWISCGSVGLVEDPVSVCIFCWSPAAMSNEHVLSRPVRKRLLGLNDETPIEWTDGSSQLWAGPNEAASVDTLVVSAVCEPCNNRWMQELDEQASKVLYRWANNPNDRLGRHQFEVVLRWLTKLLWVVRVGEDWTSGAWIRGERSEPEFIPVSLIEDGRRIQQRMPDDDFALRRFVGVARAPRESTSLISIPPVTAEGIRPTQKARRVNAALIVTLRNVELRLWIVATGLDDRWDIRWPKGVTALKPQSRFRGLSTVRAGDLSAPGLSFLDVGPVPNVELMFDDAFRAARQVLQSSDVSGEER